MKAAMADYSMLASVESISFDVTLSEEGEANLASIFEPLGDLEIVPNPEKPGEDGGDGDDS